MCGIAGIFDPAGQRSPEALTEVCRSMAEKLRHRGPDDAGAWTDVSAGIGFGHRRLSVIDLSAAGHQPMVSASGRYVLNYNGEIYNFSDLRRTLEASGVQLRGTSDTEVLLETISTRGLAEALRQANGMFAFALWDREERSLHLVRDRMGQKPLYYGFAGGALVFASELKATDAIPGLSRELNRNALPLYLRYGYIPDPHTIWEEYRKLPAGHLVTISARHVTARQLPEPLSYWSLGGVAAAGRGHLLVDDEEAEEELDRLLRDAVRRCMVADVPLGVFLSGGIDSSAVAALMQAQGGRPVRTFTAGFRQRDHNEAAYAQAVARHLGTQHVDFHVEDAEARDAISVLPEIYDEPFADSSQIPSYLISKLARQHVTVSLSGDGGDELFGGYNRHVWASRISGGGPVTRAARRMFSGVLHAVPPGTVDSLAAFLPDRLRPPQAGDKLRKLAEAFGSASAEAAYGRLISIWQNPEHIVAGGNEAREHSAPPLAWPRLESAAESMMLLDAQMYLPGDILTKVDRASMAVSLETRMPFLDHRVVEFAWRLPVSMRIRGGTGKWILRRVLDRYVPRALLERPKAGFSVPLGSWLRGALKDWAEDLLAETRLRREGYFDPVPIRQMWAEHLSGRRNAEHAIWAVLMFQAWLERRKAA